MTDMSDYLENELLDHSLGVGAFTAVSAVYMALYTVAPTDAGGGTELTNGVNGYARQSVTFGAASGGASSNTNLVQFTASGGNWGTLVAVALWDSLTSGSFLYWTAITNVTINDGDTLQFAIGDIDVTLD